MVISQHDIIVPHQTIIRNPNEQMDDSIDFNSVDMSAINSDTETNDEIIENLKREAEELAIENTSVKEQNAELVQELAGLKQMHDDVLLEKTVLCAEKSFYEQQIAQRTDTSGSKCNFCTNSRLVCSVSTTNTVSFLYVPLVFIEGCQHQLTTC